MRLTYYCGFTYYLLTADLLTTYLPLRFFFLPLAGMLSRQSESGRSVVIRDEAGKQSGRVHEMRGGDEDSMKATEQDRRSGREEER